LPFWEGSWSVIEQNISAVTSIIYSYTQINTIFTNVTISNLQKSPASPRISIESPAKPIEINTMHMASEKSGKNNCRHHPEDIYIHMPLCRKLPYIIKIQ
jgi:hypothetical protein